VLERLFQFLMLADDLVLSGIHDIFPGVR